MSLADTGEQRKAQEELRDRGSRFLQYLSAVAKQNTESPHDFRKSDECILSTEIPELPRTISVGPSSSRAAWLTVHRVAKPAPVYVPDKLKPYVGRAGIRKTTGTPKLNDQFKKLVQLSQQSEEVGSGDADTINEQIKTIQTLFGIWLQKTWAPWVEQTRIQEQTYGLYDKLFRIYLRLDQDADYYELVFGHYLLNYRGYDYPLMITPMHMSFNDSNGTITLEPADSTKMSTTPFMKSGLPSLGLLDDLQSSFNEAPIDVWSQNEYQEMERKVFSQLGPTAQISSTMDFTYRDEPELQRGWTIMFRRRIDNRGRFYESLAKKLRESDYLPVAFDSIFSSASLVQKASGNQVADDGTSAHLLMPLPANDEQKRIAQQFDHEFGVTVQGPPGTGKSHTIVNLISHLLAQGKRILITADKEQALTSLTDKIPDEVADFVMSSVGDSPMAIEKQRLSVQRMQDSLSSFDADGAQQEIDRLETQITEKRGRLKKIDEKLTESLANEVCTYRLPSGKKSAADVAKWVAHNEDLNIIPDRVDDSARLPLSASEFEEYVSLCRSLGHDDLQRSSLTLPDVESLPSGDELSGMLSELHDLQEQVEQLKTAGFTAEAVDSANDEERQHVRDSLQGALQKLLKIDEDWERQLSEKLKDNVRQRQWLKRNAALIQEQSAQCVALMQHYLGHRVEAPEGNPVTLTELLNVWKERIAQGKGIPRFSNRALREFAAGVRVDGYQPQTAEQLTFVEFYLTERQQLLQLSQLVQQTFGVVPGLSDEVNDQTLPYLSDIAQRIIDIAEWWDSLYPDIHEMLQPFFPYSDPAASVEGLRQALKDFDELAAYDRMRALEDKIGELCLQLESHCTSSDSDIWQRLADSMQREDYSSWQEALEEADRLRSIHTQAVRMGKLNDKLAAAAPEWAGKIQASDGDARFVGDLEQYKKYWSYAKASTWIRRIAYGQNSERLLSESTALTKEISSLVLKDISLSARLHLKKQQDPDERRSLKIWLDAIKKYGKGTGKNANSYLSTARHELPRAMNAMPVWIMPMHKVIDNFDPLTSRPFDVIIIDESSQCDLLSVGVLALANKAIVVGDDKQTSPSNAFKSGDVLRMLQNKIIPDFTEKSLFDYKESLYSLAGRAFPSTIMLKEHFRCVPEIIEYSNRFYDEQIFPLRECTHPEIGSPLNAHFIAEAKTEDKGEIVNVSEIEQIAQKVKQLCGDSHYDGMTMGVVVLQSSEKHQKRLTEALIDAIGHEEYAKRRIRVGNPPAFQGDERNIIFLSFVANAARTQSADYMSQWVNVAASRARDQIWAYYSFNPAGIGYSDPRRGLIEYIRDFHPHDEQVSLLNAAQTPFEKDFVREIKNRNLDDCAQMHYPIGRYDIDCVLTVATGFRLAIECDGDREENDEEFAEDIKKQRVLERLGWHFIRLSAPAYYLDPERTLEPVWHAIKELKEAYEDSRQSNSSSTDILEKSGGLEEESVLEPEIDATHLQDLTAPQDVSDETEAADASDMPDVTVVDALDMPDMPSAAPQALPESHQSETFSYEDVDFDVDVDDDDEGDDTDDDDAAGAETAPATVAEQGKLEDHLLRGELLSLADVPPRGRHEKVEKWLQSVMVMLIANEFPLSQQLLVRQTADFSDHMGLIKDIKRITNILEHLLEERLISQDYYGFYYPEPIDVPFHVIAGRTVNQISPLEIAAIMRVLIVNNRDLSREQLNKHICEIMGLSAAELHGRLSEGYRLLLRNNLIVVDHQGSLRALPRAMDHGNEVFPDFMVHLRVVGSEQEQEEQEVEVSGPPHEEVTSKSWTTKMPMPMASSPSHEKAPVTDVPQTQQGSGQGQEVQAGDSSGYGKHVLTSYGEKYGLVYASPVDPNDLPLESEYPDLMSWIQDCVVKLVSLEYPICYDMLKKRLRPALSKCGITSDKVDEILHRAIANSVQHVVEREPGFYYPKDEKSYPFRIIRHREIEFISTREIAFVMLIVIQKKSTRDESYLFDEVRAIYGFRNPTRRIQRAFNTALEYLLSTQRVRKTNNILQYVK